MKFAARQVWVVLVLVAGFCMTGAFAPVAQAAAVSIDLAALRAIQTNALDKSDEPAYVLVNGVTNGKEFSDRVPKDGTWTVGPKKPVRGGKEPITIWKGELGDGEFAFVTVTLMQGKGTDASKLKEYQDKKAEAEKKVAVRSKVKLTQDDFDKLYGDTLKAQQAVLKDIKKTFSRELKTDHFVGLFNVLVW